MQPVSHPTSPAHISKSSISQQTSQITVKIGYWQQHAWYSKQKFCASKLVEKIELAALFTPSNVQPSGQGPQSPGRWLQAQTTSRLAQCILQWPISHNAILESTASQGNYGIESPQVRLGKDIAQSQWLEMSTFKKVEMELLRVKQHTVMLGKATCCSFQSSACLSAASGSSDGEDTVNSRREACTKWVNVIKASGDTRQCSPFMMNVHQLNGQTKLCKIGLNCR